MTHAVVTCLCVATSCPVTHLAHTSSGSIHRVISGGSLSLLTVSSLSSQAFSTTASQGPSLFIRIHLSMFTFTLGEKSRNFGWNQSAFIKCWTEGRTLMHTCMPGLCWGCQGTSGRSICHTKVSAASPQTALLWLHPASLWPPPGASGSRLQLSPPSSFFFCK